MTISEAITAAVLSTVISAVHSTVPAVLTPRATVTTPAPDRQWVWPLEPEPTVVRRFDPPDQPWLPGHRGVDLAAHVSQTVRAPAAGRVSYSGVIAGRGVVVVLHGNGLRSTFESVRKGPVVGTFVSQATPVGEVGPERGHCFPATCLHWGVLRGRTYLDPLSSLGRAPVVLLPLG